jgi:type IV pilus biogenesis protein CpaD/CtpE
MPITAKTVLALGCLLAGCAELDPYQRPGVWRPLGANAANLRAMVSDPRDLEYGRASGPSPGDIGAAAVARLRADAVRRLPASATAQMKATDTSPAQRPGDAATPASPVAAQAAAAASQ